MADIFRQNIRFYGKHARYIEALSPNVREINSLSKTELNKIPEIGRQKHVFDTYVDVYVIAPLVGYLFQRTAEREKSTFVKSIMEGAVASHHKQLVFSYRLVNLLDSKSEPDLDERVRRAFHATDELAVAGMQVFDRYALGGIEVLYEKIVDGAATQDDLVRNAMDFSEEWNEKFLVAAEDLDLNALFPNR